MKHRAVSRPSSTTRTVHKSNLKSSRKKSRLSTTWIALLAAVATIIGLYAVVLLHLTQVDDTATNKRAVVGVPGIAANKPNPVVKQQRRENNVVSSSTKTTYQGWRDLAVQLASLPAHEALDALERDDPFGTRQFEENLVKEETKLGRKLTLEEVQQNLFQCPVERITLPDQRDASKAKAFRSGENFLFFQHLRKAGGTHFCSMAQANLPRKAVPRYYCMPDMEWSGKKGAGYLHQWSNEEIMNNMKEKGHRIAGNEWDNFDVEHHFDLDAVFCTSFRRPLDRALSQFRFECMENRGCKIKDVGVWWQKRVDLYNVYTSTFSDAKRRLKRIYEGRTPDFAKERRELMGTALDTVAKFNLVLAMEWLAYAGPQVEEILGFHDTSVLTKRVRPHIAQAKRDDGQTENKLGAAGITKASWDPKEYLTPEQYKTMSEHLALDEILTEAARRMFLERLVCTDVV